MTGLSALAAIAIAAPTRIPAARPASPLAPFKPPPPPGGGRRADFDLDLVLVAAPALLVAIPTLLRFPLAGLVAVLALASLPGSGRVVRALAAEAAALLASPADRRAARRVSAEYVADPRRRREKGVLPPARRRGDLPPPDRRRRAPPPPSALPPACDLVPPATRALDALREGVAGPVRCGPL